CARHPYWGASNSLDVW
nr:immunoglobulin heavy chain junction region [Macaca mulatta]